MKLVIGITASVSALLIEGQARYFKDKGYDVTIISAPGPEIEALVEREGVGFLPIPMEREISLWRDLVAFFRILAALWALRPDIVNAGTPKAGLLITTAAFVLGIRNRVYTCRGLRYDSERGFKRRLLMFIEAFTGALAHRIVCISPSLREQATVQDGLFNSAKTVVINKGSSNGVDLRRYNPAGIDPGRLARCRQQYGLGDDDFVLGFVGRVIVRKGIEEVVAAFTRLAERDEHLKLLIVGPWEEPQQPSEATIRQINEHPRIIHTGFQRDVEYFLAMMDLFVFPPHWEGFGNVLIQAAAMGLPVITTRATGSRDAAADGFNGTLVPSHDADALVRAIERYRHDPELLALHARNSLEWARNFHPEVIWEGLHDLYQENGKRKTENGKPKSAMGRQKAEIEN